MNKRLLLVLGAAFLLAAGALAGCGGDDETTGSSTDTQAQTESGSSQGSTEAAAVEATFDEFLALAKQGDGAGACDLMTAEMQKEWAEIQAEPIEIEGEVIEELTPAEAACPNSVLETLFARFPYKLEDLSVDGSEAEATMYSKTSSGWTEEGPIVFTEEDGTWLISAKIIGGEE